MTTHLFVLVGNGTYKNKGCEAIVRGTVEILRAAFGDCEFVNANFDVQNPPYIPDETDPRICNRPLEALVKWSPRWILHQVLIRTLPRIAWDIYFRDLESLVADATAILSVGGDNYTLDYGEPKIHIALDDYVARKGKPLIIWGASVGPFDTNTSFAPHMHKHLRAMVKAIFVREKRSLAYLRKYHITDNVYLASDPAFVMMPVSCSLEELGFEIPEGAIGFNLSPMMNRFVNQVEKERFLETALNIVNSMRDLFDRPIVLIAHVTSSHSNDYALLSDIYKAMDKKNDVFLLNSGLSAAKTKWVISKLDCLVAARTHATIASFSTCVPTVSLAYSVKAYGINEMLFGHDNYVISPEEFSSEVVVDKVRVVLENRAEIREALTSRMQKIKDDAMSAGVVLRDVLSL